MQHEYYSYDIKYANWDLLGWQSNTDNQPKADDIVGGNALIYI